MPHTDCRAKERKKVATCQVWCLAEVNAAMKHCKLLVVKASSVATAATAAAATRGAGLMQRIFVPVCRQEYFFVCFKSATES